MEFRRILKALWARWWVVVLVALVGGILGTLIARNHNSDIRPQWRAEAPVTFIQLDEGTATGSGSSNGRTSGGSAAGSSTISDVDVDAERARALLLLEETLRTNPRLSIEVSRADNLLLFTAVGRDGEQTLAAALSLRDEYQALGATVLSADQIDATMASLLVDIESLQQQVAALEIPEPAAEDTSVVAQRDALESEIGILEARQARLGIWIVNPELRPTEADVTAADVDEGRTTAPAPDDEEAAEPVIVTVEALEAEKLSNAVVLRRLQGELGRLPEQLEAQELDGEKTLELEALTLDIAELEAEYVDLFRRRDGRPPGGFFEEPAVSDETPSERSGTLFGFAGLLAGALLVSAAVIGLDGARQPVWAASDLDGIVSMGVVNRDRTDGDPTTVWYPASLSQRRRDIQTLRAATDAVTQEQPAIVGFFGVGVASHEVGEVAADLAAAYTVAEREVLLIDGNAFDPNTLPEFGSETGDLNDLLTTQMTHDDATLALRRFLDETVPVIPCLTAVGVDAQSQDPIDVFASPNCRLLMDVAKSKYDVVVLAGPDLADPLSDAVVRRVDFVVLVGYVGYTKISLLAAAAEVLAERRAEVAGVVLLEGRRQPVFTRAGETIGSLKQRLAGDSSSESSQSVDEAVSEAPDPDSSESEDLTPPATAASSEGAPEQESTHHIARGEVIVPPEPGFKPDAVRPKKVSPGKRD